MLSNRKAISATTILISTLLLAGYSPISIAGNLAPKPIKPTIAKPGTVTPSDVIIIGDVDCSDGHQSASCGFGDNSGWTNPGNNGGGGAPGDNGGGGGDGEQVAANAVKDKVKDVRCALGGDASATRSTASTSERWGAANQLQANINVYQGPGARILGSLVYKIVGNKTILTVTYADNGTEDWIVNPAISSISVLQQPVPGTLVLGTGNAEPSANCPKNT